MTVPTPSEHARQITGIACVLISVALFAFASLLARLGGQPSAAGAPLHPAQLASGRFFFAWLAIALVALRFPLSFRGVPWLLHLKRSVCGWLGILFLFAAALQLPLAEANAIGYLSGIVTLALSAPMLGERVGPRRWSAAVLALVGGLFIAKPGTSAFDPAALLALLAALSIGIESIFIKRLSDREPPLRILFLNNTFGTGVSLIALPFFWHWPSAGQWGILAGIGVVLATTQFFNILAFQRGDASFIAPFWYGVPLFAALYDYLWFGTLIDHWSTLGIVLIITGGIVIARRERRRSGTYPGRS